MNAVAERRLNELMMGLTREPTEAAADERIPEMLDLRLGMAEVGVPEDAKLRHLEAMSQRLIDTGTTAIRRSWRWPSTRWVWTGVAAAAVIALLIFLNTPSLRSKIEAWIPRGGGKESPLEKLLPKPQDRLVEASPKVSPKANEKPPLEPKPRKRPNQGVVVERVEIGSFKSAMGEPMVWEPGSKKPIVAKPGTKVAYGSKIETGDIDKAELVFKDGTRVVLDFNTSLVVEPGAKGALRPKELRLLAGKVSATVAHVEKELPFRIWTKPATAEAIGTKFSLGLSRPTAAKKPQVATLRVQEGSVAFFNDYGRVLVDTRYESTATREQTPTLPKRLQTLASYDIGKNILLVFKAHKLAEVDAAWKLVSNAGRTGLTLIERKRGTYEVITLAKGSPADLAGIKMGDVVSIDPPRPERSGQVWDLESGDGQPIVVTVGQGQAGRRVSILPVPFNPYGAVSKELALATRPFLEGRHDAAVTQLRVLVRSRPTAAAFNNLGVGLELQDDLGGAIRAYGTATRLDPGHPLYRANLGIALKQIGNYARAIEELESCRRSGALLEVAHCELANVYFLLGEKKKAEQLYREILVRFAGRFLVWVLRGDHLLASGRLNEAEFAYRMAEELNTGYANAHHGLALVHGRRGEHESALRELEMARALMEDTALFWNDLGWIYQSLGRYQEAEQAYRRATELEPFYYVPYSNLGNLFTDLKRYQEAIGAYEQALNLVPGREFEVSRLTGALGEVHSMMGNLAQGRRLLLRALDLDPGFVGARLALAFHSPPGESEAMLQEIVKLFPNSGRTLARLSEREMARGNLDEALGLALRAAEVDPEDYTAHAVLARLYEQLAKPDDAEREYRIALRLCSTDQSTLGNYGMFLVRRGNPVEGERYLRHALAIAPDAELYQALAVSHSQQNRFDEAASAYGEACRLNPKDATYRFRWAQVLTSAGKREEAFLQYEEAFALSPQWARAKLRAAEVLMFLGRHEAAAEAYKQALAMPAYPQDPFGALTEQRLGADRANWGFCLYVLKRFEEARHAYLSALQLIPKALPVYLGLGSIEINGAGGYEAAAVWYRKGLAVLPDDPQLLRSLSWCLAKLGENLDEALAAAQKAVSLMPNDANIVDNLGYCHFRRREFPEAEAALKKSIELYASAKGAAEPWTHLGETYEAQNRIEEAKKAYAKALELQPGRKDALEGLKRLGGS